MDRDSKCGSLADFDLFGWVADALGSLLVWLAAVAATVSGVSPSRKVTTISANLRDIIAFGLEFPNSQFLRTACSRSGLLMPGQWETLRQMVFR